MHDVVWKRALRGGRRTSTGVGVVRVALNLDGLGEEVHGLVSGPLVCHMPLRERREMRKSSSTLRTRGLTERGAALRSLGRTTKVASSVASRSWMNVCEPCASSREGAARQMWRGAFPAPAFCATRAVGEKAARASASAASALTNCSYGVEKTRQPHPVSRRPPHLAARREPRGMTWIATWRSRHRGIRRV